MIDNYRDSIGTMSGSKFICKAGNLSTTSESKVDSIKNFKDEQISRA